MTDQHTNPFVLPGLGQADACAGNPVMASMEMMRKAWQSLAEQSGFGAPAMAVPLSEEDLTKRITDLRAVENWLRMHLTVLSGTIQGLEVQRATLATFKNFVQHPAMRAGQDIAVDLKPTKPATKKASQTAAPAQASSAPATAPLFDADQAVAATQAWWDVLRQQFDSLAAATAASMPTESAGKTATGTPATKTSKKPTPAKPKKSSPAAKPAPRTARSKR